jgi:SET domain
VQVGRNLHIELNSELVYMNHSCAPTVKICVETMTVVALVDLDVGDEVTFFYPRYISSNPVPSGK